jgi:acetyltransferase-like isoleucine patch superfamily enzyme
MHWHDAYGAARRVALRRLLAHRFAEFGVEASFDPTTSRITGYERLYIGRRVFIGSYAVLSAGATVSIGDDTEIGPGFTLMTGDHEFSISGVSYAQTPGPPNIPITIGRNVWIGARVTVLKGVTIGDAAILGAGAVVTRDVPPFMIATGVPARPIRPRFEGAARAQHEAFINANLRQPLPSD